MSAGEKREAGVREALRQKARNRAWNRRMKMRKTARREVRGDEPRLRGGERGEAGEGKG